MNHAINSSQIKRETESKGKSDNLEIRREI